MSRSVGIFIRGGGFMRDICGDLITRGWEILCGRGDFILDKLRFLVYARLEDKTSAHL